MGGSCPAGQPARRRARRRRAARHAATGRQTTQHSLTVRSQRRLITQAQRTLRWRTSHADFERDGRARRGGASWRLSQSGHADSTRLHLDTRGEEAARSSEHSWAHRPLTTQRASDARHETRKQHGGHLTRFCLGSQSAVCGCRPRCMAWRWEPRVEGGRCAGAHCGTRDLLAGTLSRGRRLRARGRRCQARHWRAKRCLSCGMHREATLRGAPSGSMRR